MSFKRVARWLLAVLAGLVLLVATSAFVVQTAWFKERLRRIAVERAGQVLSGELAVGQITGSLWTGLTLHHVTLRQPNGPVVSVETIAVRYDPRLLMHRRFIFDELVLQQPVVHIVQQADGWNITHLVKPGGAGGTTAVQFRRLEIVDGSVEVTPADMPARHFAHVNTKMGLSYSGNQLDMTVQSLNASDTDTGWRVDRGHATYRGTSDGIVGSIQLDSSAGGIRGTIRSPAGGDGRVVTGDVDATHVNLSPVLARRDVVTDLNGHSTFQATLPVSGRPARLSFQVEAPSVTAVGYHADGVRGGGSYSDGVLHFDAAGSAYSASGTAKGEWRTATSATQPNTWRLAGRFRDLDVRRVPAVLGAPRLATRLAGTYRLNLTPRVWSVQANLDRSTAEGARIEPGMTVAADNSTGVPRYEAKGRVTGLDPQRLAAPLRIATLNQPRFHGTVTGDIHVAGRGRGLDDTVLSAQASLSDSTLGPTHVSAGDVTVDLAARRLSVSFNGPFEHLTQDTLALDAENPFDLTGTANGQLVIRDVNAPVTLYTMEVTGQATLGSSTIEGYRIDTATADVSIANGLAIVRQLEVKGEDLNATAQGAVAFDVEGDSNFDLVVDAASLDEVAKRLNRPIAGAAHLEAHVTGPSDHLSAKGSLVSRDVKYGDTADALTLNTTFTADVRDQQWRNPSVTADTISTFLKVQGTEIQQVKARTVYHDNQADVDATIDQKDRSVALTGSLLMHPDHQEVHLRRLAINTGDVSWTLPAGSEAAIQYHPDRVVIKGLELARGDERVAADGVVGLNADAKSATFEGVDVVATNVQLADVNRMLLGTLPVTGTLNGQAHLKGSTASPDVTSKFTVANGSVQGTTFNSLTADASYRDRRVTFDATLDEAPGARMTATGTVPLPAAGGAAEEPMDVRVQSTSIDLGLLQPLTSEITALKGTGQFDARVSGTLSSPRIDGAAKIENAAFTVAATAVPYTAGNASLRFDGQRVAIEQLTLQDEHGHTVTAEGGLEVGEARDVRSVDVHVVLDDFDLLHNNLGEVGLDGDVKISGALQNLNVSGQLSVDRGRLEIDKLIERFTSSAYRSDTDVTAPAVTPAPNGTVPSAAPPPPVAQPPAPGTMFANATMDVRLDMPDNVIVRGRNLRSSTGSVSLGTTNLTLGGNVRVQKQAGQPIAIIGTVEAVRGYYEFQGRRFDVLRDSEVRFRGEQPIDPLLNISAEREISAVTAQVQVRGTARDPKLQLSSSPPLDEADVLSLIVFGQPINQLGESQRINLAERAGNLAAGVIASPLADSIGRALDMDVFEIRAQGENGAGPSVSLGRQVGTHVFIGVSQEFGREDVSTVSFEYRVSSLLRFVTSVAQGASQTHQTRRDDLTGFDMIFVIRY